MAQNEWQSIQSNHILRVVKVTATAIMHMEECVSLMITFCLPSWNRLRYNDFLMTLAANFGFLKLNTRFFTNTPALTIRQRRLSEPEPTSGMRWHKATKMNAGNDRVASTNCVVKLASGQHCRIHMENQWQSAMITPSIVESKTE